MAKNSKMKIIAILLLGTHLALSRTYNYSMRIGSIFESHDSVLSSGVQESVFSINNSTSLLPSTRLDLHTIFTDSRDPMTVYQAVCSQLEHSVVTLLTSGDSLTNPQTNIVTDLLNRWHLPHFSAQIVSAYKMDRNPYTIYLGPSKELMMESTVALVKSLSSRYSSGTKQGGIETPPHFKAYKGPKRVGLVTHHTGVLDTAWTLTLLQSLGHETVVELLQSTDVRPHLARMRSHQVDIIIVDMADSLIKLFLNQDFPPLDQLDSISYTDVTMYSFSLEKSPSRDTNSAMAILHDSLMLFSSVVAGMEERPEPQRLNCSDPDKVYSAGETLLTTITNHETVVETLTGNISLARNMRANMELWLIQRRNNQERVVGVFKAETGEIEMNDEDIEELNYEMQEIISNLTVLHLMEKNIFEELESLQRDNLTLKVEDLSSLLVKGSDWLSNCDLIMAEAQNLLSILPSILDNKDDKEMSPHIKQLDTEDNRSGVYQYLITFSVSYILTILLLSFVSAGNVGRSLIESVWLVTTATLLNIQHSRLQSTAAKLIVIGWSVFCLSLLANFIVDYVINHSDIKTLYILANSQCPSHDILDHITIKGPSGDPFPTVPAIILSVTLVGGLIVGLLDNARLRMKRSRKKETLGEDSSNDSSSQANSNDIGSDQKLLPWSDKTLASEECSNHSV